MVFCLLGFGDKVFLFHLTRHIVCDTEFFSLNGKDEARQKKLSSFFHFIDENVGSLFVCLDQRPVFIFTYLDGRIISEDTDLCDIPTVPLHCLSGKTSDSGNDGEGRKEEKRE